MENMEQRVYDACVAGNVATFVENPLVLKQTTASGETPLHLASKFKRKDLALAILRPDLLLDPSLVTKIDCEGETPLHKACRVGEPEIVKQMLYRNPSVRWMLNNANRSALFIACENKHLNVASEICNPMPSLTWDEKGVISLLHLAATEGDADIVQKILEENRSLASRKDDSGFSAMHLASREGKDGVIKTLIEKDSNLSFLKDNNERTPLHSAVDKNQLSVVEAFLLPTSLTNSQVTQLINGVDKDGNTVLHLAAINDNLPVIERILTKRLIKVNDANNEGLTALDILKEDQPSEAREDASSDERASRDERARIIDQLKDRKRPDPKSTTSLDMMQQALLVVAALIVTLTFQAGLNPPGGIWQDSEQNHNPGKAIQSETNLWLFTVFLAFIALGFISSLALIPLIMILRTNMLWFVNLVLAMALVSVEVAFMIGLIMISDRKPLHHVDIFLLIIVTLAGIGWAKWKHAQRK